MTDRAYFIVVMCGLLLAAHIMKRIQAGRLRVGYALAWGAVGVGVLLVAIWRGAVDHVAALLGIDFGPSVLLLFGGLFGVVYLLHLSEEVSLLRARSRRLAQELALMQERLALEPVPREAEAPARRRA